MAKLTIVSARIRKEIKGKPVAEALAIVRGSSESEAAVVATLNFLEKLGLMVAMSLADEAILKRYFESIVRVSYHAWSDFIQYKRNELESPSVFSDLETLAKKWAKG